MVAKPVSSNEVLNKSPDSLCKSMLTRTETLYQLLYFINIK